MTTRSLFLSLLFWVCFTHCTSTQPVTGAMGTDRLSATTLLPFGRTAVGDEGLELVSSAAHFGFSFEGRECRIVASLPGWLSHNYLQYELDGVYQKRLRVHSKTADTLLITVPNGGRHTVWVYKATEAHTGPVYIKSILATGAKPLARPQAPLIEFIGNSITCGAAADPSEVPCGTGVYHDQHNAYQAYGPRVARMLGANFLLSSVSGIGIYRNWNSDGPTMPQVYEKLDFQEKGTRPWNFGTYNPKVVSIALGTNDFSRGDGKRERLPFDSARFVSQYIGFVQQVKATYPAAQIALLSSPMINGEARTLLQNCLSAVKAAVDAAQPSAKPVSLFFFRPMQARGCTGHPDVTDHQKMAEEAAPFFRQLLQ